MAGQYNLILLAGQGLDATTCQWRWSIRDNAGVLTPVDLTGYAARAQIRSSITASGAPLADWTTANGKIILGGAAGTITPVVADTETRDLWSASLTQCGLHKGRPAYRLGYWDLELVPPSAAVRRFLQGECWIVPEVTR